MENSRRNFIKNMAATTSFVSLGGIAYGFTAKSYSRIIGANDRITVGVMGTNGRGRGMARNFASRENTEVSYICDIDDNAIAKGIDAVKSVTGVVPKV